VRSQRSKEFARDGTPRGFGYHLVLEEAVAVEAMAADGRL
jgi:hypothetical protein